MRINQKVEKKMRLAEPKTQLFSKSCVLGSRKRKSKTRIIYRPQEVHKSKRVASILSLLPLGACYYENAPKYIISSLMPSRPYLISLLFTPHEAPLTPPISALCSALSVVSLSALSSVLLPLLLLSFFVFFNAILIFFFFFFYFFIFSV